MTVTDEERAPLRPADAILLQGGQLLLLFEAGSALPGSGRMLVGDRIVAWHAVSWEGAGGAWAGLALVDAMPPPGAELVVDGGERVALVPPPSVDVVPDGLVALARRAGLDAGAVFAFLLRHLVEGRPQSCEVARAHRAFARAFLMAATEPDGFVEIVGRPDYGGLFLQGWSLSLAPGPMQVTSAAEDLALRKVEVAVFERPDVLPPARGFCLFGKDWEEAEIARLTAVFFERDGRMARLDVVRAPVLEEDVARAAERVRAMLPRLQGSRAVVGAFRRICRPRYAGVDTLSATALPVAAALDVLLEAPDGSFLAGGWLLDPLGLVEMAILKSTEGSSAPLHAGWTRLPRPDLAAGFAADPRFAACLDAADQMHGFVVHAVPTQRRGGEAYLELVLDEGALFLPVRAAQAGSAERVTALLPALAPPEPEFEEIVPRHLAPFLAALEPRCRRGGAGRPIALARGSARPAVTALMPVERLADLQPVLGLLAGSAEAAALHLMLVLPRALAREGMRRLEEAVEFYGLHGDLVVVPDALPARSRLDAGLEVARSEKVLVWHPSALPQGAGWLGDLLEESAGLDRPNLISPRLVYEDGSTFYAGVAAEGRDFRCGRLGYARDLLLPEDPRAMAAGAAEVALVDREAVVAAGGFAGRLFSGHYAQVDLSRRLASFGIGSWCSGRVAFWKLDDAPAGEPGHADRLLLAIDRALLARPPVTGPELEP